MTDGTTASSSRERALIAPFATAIHAKASAMRELPLTTHQAARLRESIGTDIRKCCDLLMPDPRPALVSSRAAELANGLDIDLTAQTWQTQRRFDPDRSTFHYEHFAPVGELGRQCRDLDHVEAIAALLEDQLRVVWITKDEDRELTRLGFRTRRRDPRAAYEAAGITIRDLAGREVGVNDQ